jgi:Flp pilus assembly protein TadG
MSARNRIKTFWRDRRGSNAVEFAFVAPAFLAFVVGGMYAAMGVHIADSMQQAVEIAARCAALSSSCSSSSTAISYAQSHYYGPATPAPTFTYATPACGYQLNASATYSFYFVFTTVSVPLTATSCHPSPGSQS